MHNITKKRCKSCKHWTDEQRKDFMKSKKYSWFVCAIRKVVTMFKMSCNHWKLPQ